MKQFYFDLSISKKQHNHTYSKEKFGGDVLGAAVGGAITGLASSFGVKGGEYLGNISKEVVGKISGKFIAAAAEGAVKTSVTSFGMTYGSNMSQMVLNGETNMFNILNESFKQSTSKSALKNYMTSAIVGSMGKVFGEYIKEVKINYNNNLTKGISCG